MLHAEWKGRAVVHDQRCPPGIGSKDVGELAVGIHSGVHTTVQSWSVQVGILSGHDREPTAMGGSVVSGPREAESERISVALRDSLVQLLLQIRDQRGLVRFQARPVRIAIQCQRAVELEVRKSTDVIKIKSIRSVIGANDVLIGPVRCLLEVIAGIGVRQPIGQVARLQGKVGSVAPHSRSSRHSVSG